MTGQLELSLLDAPPDEDQGSEAIYGFDYQIHCVARLCLEMTRSQTIQETICEYHEDVMQLVVGKFPRLCQIKKRESADAWTIPLVKDAIRKLFGKLAYKDVGELAIYGNGRPASSGDCSLARLIGLLDRPAPERDSTWNSDILPYEQYFQRLFPDITPEMVARGLRLLRFYLTMPHPEAIKSENVKLTAEVIGQIWDVSVTFSLAQKAYDALLKIVWNASKRPKQPYSRKTITVDQARAVLRSCLEEEEYLAKDTKTVLDTKAKLQKGRLEEYLVYALQRRMDALSTKFTLSLETTEWQDLKDQIALAWEEFQDDNVRLDGKGLWSELRGLLKKLSDRWTSENRALGPEFAEGLFFDMLSVCEADVGV